MDRGATDRTRAGSPSLSRVAIVMSICSAITVLLGMVRELWLARTLRASSEADLFFAGAAIVGSARVLSLWLFRTWWIPDRSTASPLGLLNARWTSLSLMFATSGLALWLAIPLYAWSSPTPWLFSAGCAAGVIASALRALAEREGGVVLGYVSDWAPPIGVIVAIVVLGKTGVVAPVLGLFAGLLLGALTLTPMLLRSGAGKATEAPVPASRTGLVVADIVLYHNLGLLDALLSYRFAPGDYAKLAYAYLFVSAVLAVPMSALTVVGLRLVRDGTAKPWRWILGSGFATAAALGTVALVLAFERSQALLDAIAGWELGAVVAELVPWAIPFAALRIANLVARQQQLVTEPRRLVIADGVGLVVRATLLFVLLPVYGPLASPVALAVAELFQVPAWWKRSAPRP